MQFLKDFQNQYGMSTSRFWCNRLLFLMLFLLKQLPGLVRSPSSLNFFAATFLRITINDSLRSDSSIEKNICCYYASNQILLLLDAWFYIIYYLQQSSLVLHEFSTIQRQLYQLQISWYFQSPKKGFDYISECFLFNICNWATVLLYLTWDTMLPWFSVLSILGAGDWHCICYRKIGDVARERVLVKRSLYKTDVNQSSTMIKNARSFRDHIATLLEYWLSVTFHTIV